MNEQKLSKETETKPDGYTLLGDVFSDTMIKTLNTVYDKFILINRIGSIYIIGYNKDSFNFDIPKEGGDIAIAYPEKDIVVIDRDCVIPFTKNHLEKTGGWRKRYSNKEWLKGYTAGCNIFSDIVKSKRERGIL